MTEKTAVSVAFGDGIGPEIMEATLRVVSQAGANLDLKRVEIGEKVYLQGHPAGIAPEAWETIRNTKAFLKAPITTPQGGGFKSLNVTIRTTLGLYANVRPCVSYAPYIATKHPNMNVVVIRENEEDLYTGIEYRQSPDTYHALKIISRRGSERICRYAFEYARAHKRKKVTCFTKDNILKLSDGLFHQVFREVAEEYPDIENEHWIIDIGSAKLADTPEVFDVVVLPNLYGDILSDVSAQIAGSVGLAGSANIGKHGAMFEAIHGSAPRRAGKNLANPSGLMLAAIQMLDHIGQVQAAELMHNAWLKTIEDGIHTYDIYNESVSKEKVGTQEFGKAVAQRIGEKPEKLRPVTYSIAEKKSVAVEHNHKTDNATKELVGVDIFVQSNGSAEELNQEFAKLTNGSLSLKMIGNRGVRVWPDAPPEMHASDQWRCRFMHKNKGEGITPQQTAGLVQRLADAGIDFIKIENLYSWDGNPGYTVTQDEQ